MNAVQSLIPFNEKAKHQGRMAGQQRKAEKHSLHEAHRSEHLKHARRAFLQIIMVQIEATADDLRDNNPQRN